MAYNIYQYIISNTSNNLADEDKKDFNEYYEGKIEIDECLNRFKVRYFHKKRVLRLAVLDEDSFKDWIEGLGYRRYEV